MATPILKKTDCLDEADRSETTDSREINRYFMRLAYRGENFHGWQRQPGDVTVQQVVEEALARVFRLPEVAVTGAGRTDAGVNASCMWAHFDLPASAAEDSASAAGKPFPDPAGNDRLIHSLNCMLAPDVVIFEIVRVHSEAHARFDATSRSYRYYAHTQRNPFVRELSWLAPPGLDFDAMNRAAAILLEVSDFTSFSKLHTDTKTNICRVSHAAWRQLDASRWVFEITADRFLRNMVRAVVGTLVEVGRGKLSFQGFRDIIDRRDRCAAGTSMPPGPLFLHDITYPYPLGKLL